MSLLKTIKGTFKNVQDDISESLKALTVSPEKPKVPEPPPPTRVATVNYDAGAEILHRNETVWKDLYQTTEITGQKAQDVDIQIGKLFVYVDKQSEIVLKIHTEVSALPKLIQQLQDITNVLAQVEEEYDKVEAALVHLENLCEEQEYRKNISSHHNQLAVYKMKKEHELDNYRVQLARDHAHKVENINKRKQHMLHEKHVAYEEEFEKDVDYFKKHGKPGRLPSTPESVKKLDLAEVDIEEDKAELDAFLDTTDTPTSDTQEKSKLEETSDNEEPTTQIIPEITSPSESKSEITSSSESKSEITSPSELNSEITSPDEGDGANNLETKSNLSEGDQCSNTVVASPEDERGANQSETKTDLPEGDNSNTEVTSPDGGDGDNQDLAE